MGKIKRVLLISLILVFDFTGTGAARNYQTWCKSFSTGENVACSTHTDYGGTYSYTPSVAPTIYKVPDNTLFNVKYEAADHEKALFSMYLDAQISSCAKGTHCNFSNGKWRTQCLWNGVDGWVCTIYHQEAQINQYWLWANYAVTNYIYLALTGNKNSAPIITAVPAMSYPENAGVLANIVDLSFYTGDDGRKQNLTYAVTNQTNPGVVSCSVSANRYISCSTQPNANGFSDITFSAKDAGNATTSSTFRITITPANPKASKPAGDILIIPSIPDRVTPAPESPPETPEG
jgi:hypothetical protein